MNRPERRITMGGRTQFTAWQITGGVIGAMVGAAAGTVLTTASFFDFLAARFGPIYNGAGESGLLVFWVAPFAFAWGSVTGGILVSVAMRWVAHLSERSSIGHGCSRSAPGWVYGGIAMLLVPLAFWGGCVVLGFALQVLAQLFMGLSPTPYTH